MTEQKLVENFKDTQIRELQDECSFLRNKIAEIEEELNKTEEIMDEFRLNIKNMVLSDVDFYKEKEIDIWEMFLIFCLTEEERHAKGWLLPEDTLQ